ncbi:splicing factor, proline- and glutamine-rich-like [Ornithodoros turicata]
MMAGRRGPPYQQRYSPYGGNGGGRYGRYDDYNDYYDDHSNHRGYGGGNQHQQRSPQQYGRPQQPSKPLIKSDPPSPKKEPPRPSPQSQSAKSTPSPSPTPNSTPTSTPKPPPRPSPAKPATQTPQKSPAPQQPQKPSVPPQVQKPPMQQKPSVQEQQQKPPVQQQQKPPSQPPQKPPMQQQKPPVQQPQQPQRPPVQQSQQPQRPLVQQPQQPQRPPVQQPQQTQRPPVQQSQQPQRPPVQQPQQPQRPPVQQPQQPQRPPVQQPQRPPVQQQPQRSPVQQPQRPPVQQQQPPPQRSPMQQPQKPPVEQPQKAPQQQFQEPQPKVETTPKPQVAVKEDPENADNCKLFVANAPNGMTDDEFRKMFSEYGEVREVFLNKIKWFGFVLFRTHQQADQAMRALDGTEKNGRRLRVRYAQVLREREEKPQTPVVVPPVPQNAPPKRHGARCRLFVGNLPLGLSETDFKNLFEQYGELVEVYLHPQKGFGFIKYDQRAQAEAAKAALDNTAMEGRYLQIRFATQGSSLLVKHLNPWVSNELLEEAFAIFGEIDRAVVIVDDRGRSVGEGIVEFARKTSAMAALKRASQGCLLLTSSPRPVLVEPLDLRDEDDGFPEKNVNKNNPQYMKERELGPRFAEPGTFEYEFSSRWKKLLELEKQKRDFLEREFEDERHKLEEEMEFYRYEHETRLLREQLRLMEEQSKLFAHEHEARLAEHKRREEARRQEEMILRKREEEILGYNRGSAPDQQQQQQQTPGSVTEQNRGVLPPVPPTEGATFVSTYDNGRAEFTSHSPRQSRFDQPYSGPQDDMRGGPRGADQDDYSRDIKRRRY